GGHHAGQEDAPEARGRAHRKVQLTEGHAPRGRDGSGVEHLHLGEDHRATLPARGQTYGLSPSRSSSAAALMASPSGSSESISPTRPWALSRTPSHQTLSMP